MPFRCYNPTGTYHGLIFINGIGAHVKNTVSSKKDFRPQTSERAPMSGALRKESRPCGGRETVRHAREPKGIHGES